MTDQQTHLQIKNIILDKLTEWQDMQVNLQSESARNILATTLADDLETYVSNKTNTLLEDVICGGE
jgi:hypothetical protein